MSVSACSSLKPFLLPYKSSHLQKLRALIVGANVAGLSAARSLQRVGYDVCVIDVISSLEKRLAIDKGIALYGKARGVFGHLGIAGAIESRSRVVPAWSYTDHLSNITLSAPKELAEQRQRILSVRQSDILSILLDDALNKPLPPLHVHFNSQLGYVEGNTSTGMLGSAPLKIEILTSVPSLLGCRHSQTLSIPPSNGSSLEVPSSETEPMQRQQIYADLIVAADGTHSLTRRQISPCSRRGYFKYVGAKSWHGILNGYDETEDSAGPLEMVDPKGSRFTVLPLPPPTTSSPCSIPLLPAGLPGDVADSCWWAASHHDIYEDSRGAQSKKWGRVDSKEELMSVYETFADPAKTILNEHFNVHNYPVLIEHHFEDSLPEWSKNCVVFIGNAAMSCTPELLQATSIGIEDAWEASCSLSRMTNQNCVENHLFQVSNKDKKRKQDLLSIASCLYKYSRLRAHRVREYNRVTKFVRWFTSQEAASARQRIVPRLPTWFLNYCYEGYLVDSMGGRHFQISTPPPHFIPHEDAVAVQTDKQTVEQLDTSEPSYEQMRSEREQGDVYIKWLRRAPFTKNLFM